MGREQVIFHVDMDAFFASVEIRDRPELQGKPVLVGGAGKRGVVAAASYEARKFGCRSAMPMAVALRKCPNAVVLSSRFGIYGSVSEQVFEIFERFSPLVEALSIDEAFLDMTGSDRLFGSARKAADSLRAAVREETGGLTCSVGIASVKFISKIASDMGKPDGVTLVPAGSELSFLGPLPIGKLWGIGPKAEERLARHGIGTVGDLRRLEEHELIEWFGEHGAKLHRLARGIDLREVEPGQRRKSVGHEDTYADDIEGAEEIQRHLLSQATRVADRLVAKAFRGRRVQLKIRDSTFKTETRQCMLSEPTAEARVIYEAACSLLKAVELEGRSFRLTGVSVAALERSGDAGEQLELDLVDEEPKGERLQGVLSAVRERFGHQALYPADAGATQRPGTTGAVTKTVDRDDE